MDVNVSLGCLSQEWLGHPSNFITSWWWGNKKTQLKMKQASDQKEKWNIVQILFKRNFLKELQ